MTAENASQSTSTTQRVSVIPSVMGIPAPSMLLCGAGIVLGLWWAVGAFAVHCVLRKRLYGEYRRLPYPMASASPMDQHSHLLVKGVPDSFFQRLDESLQTSYLVQISIPQRRKYRLLLLSLRRYAHERGADLEVIDGETFSVLSEQRAHPGRAGGGKSLPALDELAEPESSQQDEEEETGEGSTVRDKRKVILD